LTNDEIASSVREIAEGKATQAQMAGFLVALRNKGETAEEITTFASTFREYSLKIHPSVKGRLIDTCGTGGDRIKTLNVSTIAAFVAAGAGANVAKHGNRSVTSKCGSADLLERLGLNITTEPQRVKDAIEHVGIGFIFAPSFHPAMKLVGPVRRELGIRTIFNLIGPLLNPASPDAQLLGVYSADLVPKIAQVLQRLGSEEAMVIHALEGMDEISVSGKTKISWLREGEITTREYSPEELGLKRRRVGDVQVTNVDDAADAALQILGSGGKNDAMTDVVILNSAAAIMVAERAGRFEEGIELARESIESGSAYRKLEELIRFSGGDLSKMEIYAKNE
jgi:anthranilate phosphoribosyltransferase